MPSALYYFDFEEQSWSHEEVSVEGREDGLMYIHELGVYNGSLYAVNEDILEQSRGTVVEIRRFEGNVWRKVTQAMPPAWLRTVGFLETFFSEGIIADGAWLLWGSRSLLPPGASESIDLVSPPKSLRVMDPKMYFQSEWGATFQACPLMYEFETGTWTRPAVDSPIGGILGQRPISRKLHCTAVAPDGRSLLIVGGEMAPIPCASEVPIPCHSTEQLTILPMPDPKAATTSVLPQPADLLEEMFSSINEDVEDYLCDVEVYAEGCPGQGVRMSSFAMCQRSSMFRRMLCSGMLEGSTRRVELPAVQRRTLEALRALCHLDFQTLQERASDILTQVELYSLCRTYMIEPLGRKYTTDLLDSRIRQAGGGYDDVSSLWEAIHTTKLAEIFHQGLTELVAVRLTEDFPRSMQHLQASPTFQGLAEEHQATLKQYVNEAAVQRQLHQANLWSE
eukprot:CAMPEP_0117692238 /NCGR_PEP_ID=MMETSP0804-20121206/26211_1 /TAXON_ID=1074897 /ORGANISM="Tetraselmis astigmatica, Strain CCMP880" /LENGTH=449 /DNA_ID=CAMNT_0005505653 /DNA_START=88 /DNA_END=1437 /DNA_ORIENTATION=-